MKNNKCKDLKYSFLMKASQITVFLFAMLISNLALAQKSMPIIINNPSEFNDDEIYVAIVGEDLTGPPGIHVWVDLKTGVQHPMDSKYNTIQGPIYDGNAGPGLKGLYADCFTKLSDIPNKTVMLSPIQGCRIFLSVGEQLYFWFFGGSGPISGYTAPSSTDPTNPNKDILYEIIELTYNQYGFFGNPTRVDSYKAPIGLELFGANGYYKKVGEIATHDQIIDAFEKNVPYEFLGCIDYTTGEITAPSKTFEFADGSIGTMPNAGVYANYFKPYVDAIWTKYANEDLIFDSGDAGIWKGRVVGEQLIFTSISGGFLGRFGVISRRPTTQEVFEGKGVLDNVVSDLTTDLLIQAQMTAAINRHVIDIDTPNIGQQDWSDSSKYYLKSPCNYYAKFWHQDGISVNNLSYGFAYDDVWDYSPSVHIQNPLKVVITFGSLEDGEDTEPSFDLNPTTDNYETANICNGTALSGDYSYLVSNDLTNPSITFIPEINGIGDKLIILYYGTSQNGIYPGYFVKPNEPYNIKAEKGETIYFYYTYSLASGGENNSSANRHNITVGTCSSNIINTNPDNNSNTEPVSDNNSTIEAETNTTSNDIINEQDTNQDTNQDFLDNCNGTALSGDYSYAISSDLNNPTFTFSPKVAGIGNKLVILYYGTSPNGIYPGYFVKPNVPFNIKAANNETIYFYYTYSLPTGGENNSAANRHNIIVGDCYK